MYIYYHIYISYNSHALRYGRRCHNGGKGAESGGRERGTPFTCFTSTKVQILTLEDLREAERLAKKMVSDSYDFDDFISQVFVYVCVCVCVCVYLCLCVSYNMYICLTPTTLMTSSRRAAQ